MAAQDTEILQRGPQRVWLDPQRKILMAEFDDGAALELADARWSTEAMTKATGGVPRPLLVDFSNLKAQSRECRDYYAKDPIHIETYVAVAILVSNPLSRVIANFFLGINKPVKPTRLFDDKAKAIEWLEQF